MKRFILENIEDSGFDLFCEIDKELKQKELKKIIEKAKDIFYYKNPNKIPLTEILSKIFKEKGINFKHEYIYDIYKFVY